MWSMAARIFWMAGFFLAVSITLLLVIQADGQVTAYELSVFFTVFVLMQVWNLFNVRCLGSDRSAFHGILENKAFLTIAATILLGQIAIVQWGGEMFRTVPLDWQHWLVILSATSLVLLAGELVRWRNRCKGAAVLFS
jgi:P-type Ca2+ transporter type 2C